MICLIKYYISKILKKSINIPAIKGSKIDKSSRVCSGSQIVKTIINKYSYVGNNCTVIRTKIGSFCSVADYCVIGGSSHPIEWVSTSPVFHKGRNVMKKNISSHDYSTTKETILGNDVWIGTFCLIKSGITIGDGAVIGMGSVVTKDVGDYEIWAGNPAKLIRKRFDDETIERLRLSKWWNYDYVKLEQKAALFNDVDKFIQEI